MLALHVHLLRHVFVATSYNDRSHAEWPPHPARLFSALVDSLHHDEPVDPEESLALDALAKLPAPRILASDQHTRDARTFFVPVNDTAVTDGASLVKKEAALLDARSELAALPSEASSKVVAKAERAVTKAQDALAKQAVKSGLAPSTIPATNPAPQATPWARTRQARTFPTVVPHHPDVTYLWPDTTLSDEQVAALDAVAARVHRLGHSSSMVSVSVLCEPPEHPESTQSFLPDEQGPHLFRLPQPGQRVALEQAYEQHQGDLPGRVLPATHVRYRIAGREQSGGNSRLSGGRWFSYRFAGRPPAAAATTTLAGNVRRALLKFAPDPVSPWLSGHGTDGPARHEHLTVLGLPFVGHPHADGHLRGVAILLPPDAPAEAEQELLSALGRWEQSIDPNERCIRVHHGKTWREAERVVDAQTTLVALQPATWCAASRRWTTVTPIALDGSCPSFNHPKPGIQRKARKVATQLIQRAVLRAVQAPEGKTLDRRDIGVELVFGPTLDGTEPAQRFPAYGRSGHARPRRLVHAVITLPFAIEGPLVLGAGRHFGLGLCRPTPLASETAP